MTKVNIFSGFLGAGKTTLIKKLLADAWKGEKVVLIENEFGEIGIDGGFLREAGIEITEMNSGCICCSLVGDFGKALEQVTQQFNPDRIIIEPSGVGKLSDVIQAVERSSAELAIVGRTAVVDAAKCKMYAKNFGEFYNDQIQAASAIVLSRSQNLTPEKLAACEELLRSLNADAAIVTTPWDELDAATLMGAIEPEKSLEDILREQHEHEHHHHYDENGECSCGHHHHDDDDDDDDDDDEHEHHHHHHDHDDEDEHEHHHHHHDHDDEDEHEHHHHHHDHDHDHEDGECSCGHDHHHHHHDHDADEVFSTWGNESSRAYTEEELGGILTALDSGEYGTVLRAKGIVPCADGGKWLHFDYVPEEHEIRRGAPDYTGRLCVIGAELNETALAALFGKE
jgi:G3E family GTPase